MPRKNPPHVESWRDRHGKLRVYFRRGSGPRVPLPDAIGSDEFNAAYAAALAGDTATRVAKRPELVDGTIDALIVSYMKSAGYRSLRDTTKKGYVSRIEALRTGHGHRTVKGLTRERINDRILLPYADKPGAGINMLKLLRVLIRHAIEIGWLDRDPSSGIKRPKGKEVRAWTDAEIARFEGKWALGTKQRLAFALMLFTGQRRSDVHRMTWADISDGAIRIIQQKTGARLAIPLHARLREVLAAADRSHMTIVNTEYGKPFTVDGFSQFMRDAITAANLPLDCQPHGLRKAAGRMLAEAGCTAHEIMSVLGHKTLAEAERYTRDADQMRLAASAITKMEGRRRNKASQTAMEKFGKTSN